jgi:prophage regulatory protein
MQFIFNGEVINMSNAIQYSILRRKQVQARTGLARSTMYQQIQDGTFPRPIPLGPRAVGWLESEVSNWIAERVRIARSDVESNADGGRHDASAD